MKFIISFFICVTISLSSFGQNIIGGSEIDITDAPYQVSIQCTNGGCLCGGIILSERWILTAAHCVYGTSGNQLKVHAGKTNFSTTNGYYQTSSIENYYIQSGYNNFNQTWENDIALIYLETPLIFDSKTAPID